MSRLSVLLLVLVASSTVVSAAGPKVVFSKTWYEPMEYAGTKWIFRHFTFTFDQPLFLKDKFGTVASIADPVWYIKQAADGTKAPRLMCSPSFADGYQGTSVDEPFEPATAEPKYLGQTHDGWFAGQVQWSNNPYTGCNPYFFRAFDGNFVLTDTRVYLDPIQIGPNHHFTYASKKANIPKTVRLPDYDGTALHPGVKQNDRGYNSTQLYFDMLNYNALNIPFDLIDDTTLTLTDIYYIEDSTDYGPGNEFPWASNYGSAPTIAGRSYYGKFLFGNGDTLTPQLNLLCSTQTSGLPFGLRLKDFDPTFFWPIPDAKRALIINAAGEEAIPGASSNLNYNYAACTVDDLKELNKKYADIQAAMLKTSSPQALTTLQVSLKTLAAQYPYDACFTYINTLYNTSTTDVDVAGQTECRHTYGTLDYSVDPCCNMTLSFTQCCAPKTIKKTTTVAKQLSDGAQCVNPTPAFTAIQTLVKGLNTGDAANSGSEAATITFTKLTAFQGQCHDLLFNTTCSNDEQCQYGSTCDLTNQICIPPYDRLAESTLACYTDKMDRDLKNRLIAQLGVQLDANGQPVPSDFIAKFSAAVVREDCVGPTASQYRTRYQYGPDGRVVVDRFGAPVVLAGSQASCLADQQCAFNIKAGEPCASTKATGSSFCGLCNDKSCQDITRPAQCVVTAFTSPNTCAAAGLFWKDMDSQSVYSRYFPGQTGVCLDLDANTEDKCLTAQICPKSTVSGDSMTRCAKQLCYSSAYTTAKRCEQNDGDWEPTYVNGNGLCTDAFDQEADDSNDDYNIFLRFSNSKWLSYVLAFRQRQSQSIGCQQGFQRFTGRVFIPGKFDTESACAAGQCSIRNDNQEFNYETETLNASQCAALKQCTTTCPRCRSAFAVDSSAAPELVCYETRATNKKINSAKKCKRDGGVWTRLSDKSYICRYTMDKQACLAANHQVIDCSGMSKDTCFSGTSPLEQLLQCRWSTTSTCPLSTCPQQGFCNDGEFINNKVTAGKNGAQPTGACLVPAPLDGVEQRPCTLIRSINNSTVHTYQTASKIAGICLDFTVDKTACAALGYKFQDMASTADSCAAHGSNCFEVDGTITAKPQQQCELCGGKSAAAYRWTAARVDNGFIRTNTQWKAREQVSVNSWKPTVVFPLLDQLIQRVTLRKVAVEQISAVSLHMSTVLSMMNALACDCTTKYKQQSDEPFGELPPSLLPGDLSCYNMPPVQQAIGDLVSGSAIQLFTTSAVVFVDQTIGTGFTKTLQLGLVPAQSLATDLSAIAITDATGKPVAYLTGHGLNLNDSVLAGTTTVVLQLNDAIGTGIPAEFSGAGVAQLINGKLELLETASSFVNKQTAVQTASISAQGTYFPVKVTPQTQATMTQRYASKFASAGDMTSASFILIAVLALLQLLF